MKNFFAVAALSGIWILVEGAHEMEPDSNPLLSNISAINLQEECIAKVQNDSIKLNDLKYFNLFFLKINFDLIKRVQLNEIPITVDGMPERICNSSLDVDRLYSLVMNITKICMNEVDNFTEEEQQIVKSKLRQIYCYGYMKFVAIRAFLSDDVCSNDEAKWNDLKKCARQSVDPPKTIREAFFGDAQSCRAKTKILDCGKTALKGICQPKIADRIESIFNELQDSVCETEPNSGDAINSL